MCLHDDFLELIRLGLMQILLIKNQHLIFKFLGEISPKHYTNTKKKIDLKILDVRSCKRKLANPFNELNHVSVDLIDSMFFCVYNSIKHTKFILILLLINNYIILLSCSFVEKDH